MDVKLLFRDLTFDPYPLHKHLYLRVFAMRFWAIFSTTLCSAV